MDVPCIKCGETGCVYVSVEDGGLMRCSSCEEEFTVANVTALIAGWAKVLEWLKLHPSKTGGNRP